MPSQHSVHDGRQTTVLNIGQFETPERPMMMMMTTCPTQTQLVSLNAENMSESLADGIEVGESAAVERV